MADLSGEFELFVVIMIYFQIILAIHALHTKFHVIHCDVKPHNILLFEDQDIYSTYAIINSTIGHWQNIRLKICDFGLAQILNPPDVKIKFNGLRGTQGYFAPELLLVSNVF